MLIALLLLAAASPSNTAPAREPVPGRSVVASRYGVVSSSQPLAAAAGVQILERGGNAVDAAIAANATTGVMEPTGSGIGGDLFALIYLAKEDKLYGLNASGWSAKGMTPEFVRSKGGLDKLPQRGALTVTVPGVVAGWDALQKRFGAVPLSVSLAPAIFHAEQGFPLMEITAGLWARSEKMLAEHPNSRGIAALEILNNQERFPLGEWGFHSTRALHTMIEAKKLAYADLLRYVGDPRFGQVPVAELRSE